jgi:hypothetical protein
VTTRWALGSRVSGLPLPTRGNSPIHSDPRRSGSYSVPSASAWREREVIVESYSLHISPTISLSASSARCCAWSRYAFAALLAVASFPFEDGASSRCCHFCGSRLQTAACSTPTAQAPAKTSFPGLQVTEGRCPSRPIRDRPPQAQRRIAPRRSRYSHSEIAIQIGAKRVVIGFVEEVGLARSDMSERGQHPGESLAQIGEIWHGALRLMQFAIEFHDPLTELPVLRSDPAHAVA